MKIKTIIFDFGDVFINLDKEGAMQNALTLFQLNELPEDLIAINTLYEQGLISSDEFIEFYTDNFPKLSKKDILDAWNFILKDFPEERLTFLKNLKKEQKHKLILLSNTNEIHINWIKEHVSFYEEFKACFDQFYLSHDINLRKPNQDIYQFVLNQNKLKADECLFIDDTKDNTDAAAALGIHIWNIDETKENVIDLFSIKEDLF
ncbi:HAD family hydrolase [Psychroserpens ponticola]|uniref:HAD family phosphatase n=1 Tax=Psychroserpens ponticola TaxID=2932268 RepID=A0ABY7RUD5_9FLAO|nr:HAD family phosphatase [Psychroserpens ponticola]WCO00529.1 HAD family phosphatase [Psychroserpens ponticola]